MTIGCNNPDEILLEFPDEKLAVRVPVTRVGTDLYRLEAVPHLSTSAGYTDVVEAVSTDVGRLHFVELRDRRGGVRTRSS